MKAKSSSAAIKMRRAQDLVVTSKELVKQDKLSARIGPQKKGGAAHAADVRERDLKKFMAKAARNNTKGAAGTAPPSELAKTVSEILDAPFKRLG